MPPCTTMQFNFDFATNNCGSEVINGANLIRAKNTHLCLLQMHSLWLTRTQIYILFFKILWDNVVKEHIQNLFDISCKHSVWVETIRTEKRKKSANRMVYGGLKITSIPRRRKKNQNCIKLKYTMKQPSRSNSSVNCFLSTLLKERKRVWLNKRATIWI